MKVNLFEDSGEVKGVITIKAIDITTGVVKPIGNGAHILIKKKKAEEIGFGRRVGIIFFEVDENGHQAD